MFAGWGSRVARLRWPVLIVALVAVIGSGIWGFGVFGQLTEGGYNDPRSESARAAEVAAAATGGQGGDVIAIYTPDQGAIDDAALTKRIKERLAALPKTAVESQSSYWDKKAAAYASKDKKSAVAVITLSGEDDAAKMDAYADIEDALSVPGAHVQLAGGIPLGHASSQRSTDDLAFAEMVSLPIVLILLLLIFGSLVAASLPVLVGGAAVLGSLGVLHAIALAHEVNSFAVNVASLLGLGMAIDYGLFMVGRFREEQAVHHTADAVRRTVATAGRTVVFSATLLMTALAGLLLFPQGFLKSLAYGGLAAVFLAMLLSLTLLPALLAVLGPRVDLIPIRLPGRGATNTGGWERLAGWVLRRPVLVAVPIFAALVVLALPIADARFGENDERQLPAGDPSRVAIETLEAEFPQFASDGVQVVVHTTNGKKPDVKAFSDAAAKVTGIEKITTTGGDDKGTVILTADLKATDAFSDEARDAVDGLRALTPPAGAELLVGGVTARNVDSLEAIGAELPLMIGLLAGATLVLMFLAFGSILLPIKAVVMSALSLTATFGSLVWIFQEGHGASWLDVTPTPLEAGIVVLMAAVVFGLSTDYEVFLLSRMVEARLRGATTREAVTVGLARTGRVISAAALLLIVVTGAFALSSVTTMRFIGVGMIIALVLDATVVRVLLVPAVLAVLGDASWWAPGPLRRLQEKAGLAEYAGEEEATGRHAWRPIDPSLEETTVLDGTLLARALPAAPAQVALPSGSETSNTVVLDYEAVLDYLSEKNQSAGTPSDHPVQDEASSAPAEPHAITGPGRHRDALAAGGSSSSPDPDSPSTDVASSSAVSSSASNGAASSASSGAAPSAVASSAVSAAISSAAAPAAVSSDAPSSDAPSSAVGASSASEDAVSPAGGGHGDEAAEPVGPDDLWAEVEATLAAGAEIIRPDTEPSLIEAYTEANSPEDFDPSVTHVLRLPTESSSDDPAATQVLHLPGTTTPGSGSTVSDAAPSVPAPEEPVIFSETVYNGLFTEETVRAATPDPEPEEALPGPEPEEALADPEPEEALPGPRSEEALPHIDPDLAADVEPPLGDTTTRPADDLGTGSLTEDAAPVSVPPADASPGSTAPADVSSTDVPAFDDSKDVVSAAAAAPADVSSTDSGPVASEPVALVPDVAESTPVKPAESSRSRSDKSTAAEDDEVAYFLAPFADTLDPETSEPSPFDLEPPFAESTAHSDMPPAPAPEPAAHPYEPVAPLAEPTARPYEPVAPLAGPAAHPYEPVAATRDAELLADAAAAPATLSDGPPAEPVTDPFSWRDDPRLAAITAAEPDDFPWLDRYATTPGTPEPATPTTDTLRPDPVEDRTVPHRPQTLDDWLTTAPPPSRPEPPVPGLTPAASEAYGAPPAPRPATLGDLPATPVSPASRPRPASLADLPTRSPSATTPPPAPVTPGPAEPVRPAIDETATEPPTAAEDLRTAEVPAEATPDTRTPDQFTTTSPLTVAAESPDKPTGTGPEPAEPIHAPEPAELPTNSGETVVEPAADDPIEITDLEPADPDATPTAAESGNVDEVAEEADGDEVIEMAAVAEAAEPVEVDAWRDPTILAQSALSTAAVQSVSGPPAAEGVNTPNEADRDEVTPSPSTSPDQPATPEPRPVAEDHDEPAHEADATTIRPVSAREAIEEPVDETPDDPKLEADAAGTTHTTKPADPEPADPAEPAQAPEPETAAPTSYPRRPQTLDDWLADPAPLHRPRTLEDLPLASARPQTLEEVTAARPQTLGDVSTGVRPAPEPAEQPTEADYARGRRPETLDDRIRGTVRPVTLADHLPDQGRSARRPANTGPSWADGSGEHPYDRQTRRPASLADHPGPARPTPDPAADEPGPDPER